MSIYGISTEFTESIRFVTTVHSIDLFSDRNGSKCAQTNTEAKGQSELLGQFRESIKLIHGNGREVPNDRK